MYARTNGRNYGASPRPGEDARAESRASSPRLAAGPAVRTMHVRRMRCVRWNRALSPLYQPRQGEKKPTSIHLRPLKMYRSRRNAHRRINIAETTRGPGYFRKCAIGSRYEGLFRMIDYSTSFSLSSSRQTSSSQAPLVSQVFLK